MEENDFISVVIFSQVYVSQKKTSAHRILFLFPYGFKGVPNFNFIADSKLDAIFIVVLQFSTINC
jgi:hypothetical protein